MHATSTLAVEINKVNDGHVKIVGKFAQYRVLYWNFAKLS